MSESSESAAQTATAEQRALERAERAFAAGDYAAVRAALPGLRAAESAEVRARAEQLARAISEDPAFAAVIAACLVGFFAVVMHYVLG